MDERRARSLGRHVTEPPVLLEPKARAALVRKWIADTDKAAAKLPPQEASWLWIVLAFQIDALLGPTGLLHVQLERSIAISHDALAREVAARRKALREIAARRDLEQDLQYAYQRHEAGEALYRNVLQQGNDPDDATGAAAIAIALYTPAELLARYTMGPGLAELLSLPFRVIAPGAFAHADARLAPGRGGALDERAVRAALDDAIEHASAEWPSLRIDAGAIDAGTAEAFVVTLNAQLQDQVLDAKAAPAKRKKPRAARAAAPREPDWKAIEDGIVAAGARAARSYAEQRGAAAALVLDTDPPASYVLFSFATAAELVAHAAAHFRDEAVGRAKALAGPRAWKEAPAIAAPQLASAISPGDFEDMDFDRVDFGEVMAAFAASDACPEPPPDGEDYVRARFRLALAGALDRLVADGALDVLRGDAPLVIGYTFHEEPPVVLHVLAPATTARTRSASGRTRARSR